MRFQQIAELCNLAGDEILSFFNLLMGKEWVQDISADPMDVMRPSSQGGRMTFSPWVLVEL